MFLSRLKFFKNILKDKKKKQTFSAVFYLFYVVLQNLL